MAARDRPIVWDPRQIAARDELGITEEDLVSDLFDFVTRVNGQNMELSDAIVRRPSVSRGVANNTADRCLAVDHLPRGGRVRDQHLARSKLLLRPFDLALLHEVLSASQPRGEYECALDR